MTEREVEIVVVMQPIQAKAEPLDEMGYPIGYFGETYGILADDPTERNQPPCSVQSSAI